MARSYPPDDMSSVSSISELNLSNTSSSLTLFSTDGGSLSALDGSFKVAIPVQNAAHKWKPPQMSQIEEEVISNTFARNEERAADSSHDEISSECTDLTAIIEDCSNKVHNSKNAITKTIGDSSVCSERCDFDNDKTRDLLQHYLESSDSTDKLKFNTVDFYKYFPIITKTLAEFINFMVIVVMSKHFWNSCVMIAHIGIAVFFYLVLAMSTIMVTIIVNLHDAIVYREEVQREEDKLEEEEKAFTLQRFIDIDEISV